MSRRSEALARALHPRKRSAGQVMIEALIVCVMLSVFIACTLFLQRMYHAKLATIAEARLQAWSEALRGCAAGPDTQSPALSALTGNLPALIANIAERDPGEDDVSDWLVNAGRGEGAAPVRSVAAPSGRVFQLQTRMSVACNETAAQRARSSSFGTMWGYLRSLF